jgi:hypothetical protein
LTSRKGPASILLIAAATTLAIILAAKLGRIARLDADFADLKEGTARATQVALASHGAGMASPRASAQDRFFALGSLPDPLSLASDVLASMKEAGIVADESRIAESTKAAQWIRYRAEGTIESWFRFIGRLRARDARALFRSLSLAKRQGFAYSISFEVGHAVLP